LLGALPRTIPGAVLLVVQQGSREDESGGCCDALAARCDLRVVEAKDKMPLRRGSVFVAPAGYHLLVDGQRCVLAATPPEYGQRPSVTALVETAAWASPTGVAVVFLGDLGADGRSALHCLTSEVAVLHGPADLAAQVLALPEFTS
jgi:two-component system chemotaxis response regulator CheB